MVIISEMIRRLLEITEKIEPNRHKSNYWSMDIFPRGVKTNRIFRTFI